MMPYFEVLEEALAMHIVLWGHHGGPLVAIKVVIVMTF